jgi:ABC-type uncharacterized transport system permease subunit
MSPFLQGVIIGAIIITIGFLSGFAFATNLFTKNKVSGTTT